MARKIKVITPAEIEEIERMAGLGFTQEQMAIVLNYSLKTWFDIKNRQPEMDLAIKRGKCQTLKKVTGKLMKLIDEGNVAAIIFYLKTQHRWSELNTLKMEQEDNASKVKPALTLTVHDPNEAAKIYQQIMTGS